VNDVEGTGWTNLRCELAAALQMIAFEVSTNTLAPIANSRYQRNRKKLLWQIGGKMARAQKPLFFVQIDLPAHFEVAGKGVANPGELRDVVTAARADHKNNILMKVRSGDASHYVAVPLGSG
jgi:hypothetical protein